MFVSFIVSKSYGKTKTSPQYFLTSLLCVNASLGILWSVPISLSLVSFVLLGHL